MRNFSIRPADVNGEKILLSRPSEVHHLAHVLRYQVGEELSLLNGEGKRYHSVITAIRDKAVEFRILATHQVIPPLLISLAQAVVKGKTMDVIVEKATELGVRELIPLKAERTSVDVEQRANSRKTRWGRIVEAACKQSGQAAAMEIKPCVNFPDLLKEIRRFSLTLFLTLDPSAQNFVKVLEEEKGSSGNESVLLVVGPEGGWTREEEIMAKQAGCIPVRLASATLRCETAVVAALAILTNSLLD